MNDSEIYDKVEKEINLMVLELYEGIKYPIEIRSKIMFGVKKAIRKTIDYKNSQSVEKVTEVKE